MIAKADAIKRHRRDLLDGFVIRGGFDTGVVSEVFVKGDHRGGRPKPWKIFSPLLPKAFNMFR